MPKLDFNCMPLILVFVFFLSLSYAEPLKLYSDSMTVDMRSQELWVDSGVSLNYQAFILFGNRARYNRIQNKLYLDENVSIEGEQLTLSCDNLVLDANSKTLKLKGNVNYFIGSQFFGDEEIQGESGALNYDINKASIIVYDHPKFFSGNRLLKGNKIMIDLDRKSYKIIGNVILNVEVP